MRSASVGSAADGSRPTGATACRPRTPPGPSSWSRRRRAAWVGAQRRTTRTATAVRRVDGVDPPVEGARCRPRDVEAPTAVRQLHEACRSSDSALRRGPSRARRSSRAPRRRPIACDDDRVAAPVPHRPAQPVGEVDVTAQRTALGAPAQYPEPSPGGTTTTWPRSGCGKGGNGAPERGTAEDVTTTSTVERGRPPRTGPRPATAGVAAILPAPASRCVAVAPRCGT